MAQFSLYVHNGALKPDSFHFISIIECITKHKKMYFVINILLAPNTYSLFFWSYRPSMTSFFNL